MGVIDRLLTIVIYPGESECAPAGGAMLRICYVAGRHRARAPGARALGVMCLLCGRWTLELGTFDFVLEVVPEALRYASHHGLEDGPAVGRTRDD